MQDRFKFRFWCEKDKTMYYVNSNNCIFTKQRRLNLSSVFNNESDRYIPLQSTGLRDRNGKLIYEGDIVRLGQEDTDIGIVMWNDGECAYNVDEKLNHRVSDFTCWCEEYLEIISNIYENKELLKEQKC